MNSPGLVVEVLVSEGDKVEAGQVLARLDDTRLKLSVEEARLRLQQAQLDLDKAQKPADPADLTAAERAIQSAQVSLVNARGTISNTVDQAQSALRTAQLVFDEADNDYKHLLDLKSWGYDVERELKAGKLRLDNARANLDIARRDAGGASAHTNESVAQTLKVLADAQARYATLNRQPEPESITASQLAVESAKLALAQAEANLNDAALRAPMAGVVAEVKLKVGQQVGPGAPLITLADTSVWFVETDNLTELSVVDVKPGGQVTVKFDAIPGLQLPGHVERIALRSQDKRGDVTYTVRVALDNMDPRLRWGMTAFV